MFKWNYLIGLLFLLVACKQEKKLNEQEKKIDLASGYQSFENLISIADCLGPGIKYTTEVHSTKDRYTYFKQEYEPEEGTYEVVIRDGKEGFTINEEGQKTDTLSKESIEIVRSHEFHKIHMFPNQYFKNVTFEDTEHYQEKTCEKYLGTDQLENKISLYYDRKEKLIAGFKMLNPNDTTEQIEVRYLEWMESEIGKIAKKVEIIQGGKDIYQFDFKNVIINDPAFEKKIK